MRSPAQALIVFLSVATLAQPLSELEAKPVDVPEPIPGDSWIYGKYPANDPESDTFDIVAYLNHLGVIRNLSAVDFIDQHVPFGPYSYSVSPRQAMPLYLMDLHSLLSFTHGEQELLNRHGFVVSERLSYASYGDAMLDLWEADLPLFISTDAILHALHSSYVEILSTIERTYLSVELGNALDAMHTAWPGLNAKYGSTAGMRASLDDVDVFLTVARNLLDEGSHPSMGGNDGTVQQILGLIDAQQPASYPLFNNAPRIYDFSQFKPRGHYTRSPVLSRYFQAMMWLGRTEFRLSPPPGVAPGFDVSREILDAFLLYEIASMTEGLSHLDNCDAVIEDLIGSSDNIALHELNRLGRAIQLSRVDELLDPSVMSRFEDKLATGQYTAQAINSQIIQGNPLHPEDLDPPFAFLLMGQRFILDSFIAWQVVYDRIEHEDTKPFRELPSPLDVLYVLGNDDVLPLLDEELKAYHYAPNLSALRFLVDGYGSKYWETSLYTSWLDAIRSLAHSGRAQGAPEFMKTGAWQQQKMNSQLASWAELRHDNLLYAKQSYTGGAYCSFPCTYVEPIPEFYRILAGFAERAGTVFGSLPLNDSSSARFEQFFNGMKATMDILQSVAEKELQGEALSEQEFTFLEEPLFRGLSGCVLAEKGWYRDLYFSAADNPTVKEDLVIADIHTAPTDAFGNSVGHILHTATGHPKMGVFIATPPDGKPTAFAGPVASFHTHVTSGFLRLTDEEWKELYDQGAPAPPDWTYVYLADAEGEVREGGRRLVPVPEGTRRFVEGPLKPKATLAPNYPNPFRSSTLLSFRIEGIKASPVVLDVLDIRGRLVRRVVEATLPPNTYHFHWDGKDDRGAAVALGVYFAHLRTKDATVTRKLTLIR